MTYINPVVPGFNPDPSVCRVGTDYYMVTSSFMYFPGVPVYHSRDMVNWKLIGHCLDRISQLNFRKTEHMGQIFAATIRYHEGLFYMITTLRNGIGNFYVTAEKPEGSWSDPIIVDNVLFDPSLMFDDNGKVYYTRRGITGIDQAEIEIGTGRITTEPREIARGFCSYDTEGPHLYKKNNYYYLLSAEGGSRYGHMLTLARSHSPWGPFKADPDNPILTQRHITFAPIRNTGHGEIVEDAQGKWWLFFLGTRNSRYDSSSHLGRETHLLPLEWNRDGWPRIGCPTRHWDGFAAPLVASHEEKTLGPPEEAINAESDFYTADFSGPGLPDEFISIGNISPDSYELSRGELRINGSDNNLDSERDRTFFGRRQTSFAFRWEVTMDFNPEKESFAGITIYQNHRFHYDVFLRRDGIGSELCLRRRIADIDYVPVSLPVPDGPILLVVEGRDDEYRFSAIDVEGTELNIGSAETCFLDDQFSGSWTGVVLGLYAVSGTAVFRGYNYRQTEIKWWRMEGSLPPEVNQ